MPAPRGYYRTRPGRASSPTGVKGELYLKWMDLGLSEMRAGRCRKAARAFRKAITESPEDPIALLYWACALGGDLQFYRAGKICRQALRLFPGLAKTRLDLKVLYGGKEKLRKIIRALRDKAKAPEEKFFFAVFLRLAGKKEASDKLLRGLLGRLPEASMLVRPAR